MSNYYEMDEFKYIYLEDSYVLDIQESEDEVCFTIEAVLTEKHPLYVQPNENEQYCYKKAKIVFRDCKSVNWINKRLLPTTDLDSSVDFGNIDSFIYNADQHELTGDWGKMNIVAPLVNLSWAE